MLSDAKELKSSETEAQPNVEVKRPIPNLFAPDTNENQISSDLKQQYENYTNINKNVNAILNKSSWINPEPADKENLIKSLKEQIDKGQGELMLALGVSDGSDYGLTKVEMGQSVETLMSMEKFLDVTINQLRDRVVDANSKILNTKPETSKNSEINTDKISPLKDNNANIITSADGVVDQYKYIKDFLIRKNFQTEDFMEVRVAVVGNVDAGKSTLLGVLTHGLLDDGRGDARTKLFRHKHEIESGRTSSVGNDILGFDSRGKIVNNMDAHVAKSSDWEKICQRSSKVITFIDLAGHEKYLKTTVFGMTGHAPDFCMLMVGANMGVVGMTKEHLGLSLALNVPVFVVITKIDMCPPNVLAETLKILQKILKSPGCRKIAYIVENMDDVITCATNFTSERLCPIFQVSNVTGQNLDLIKVFINLLNSRVEYVPTEPAEFQIDDIYSVPGVGTVVSGTCYKGRIQLNDSLILGPDLIGQFRNVTIKGIHRKRLPVKECRGGQAASFSLKKIKRSELRKGMIIVSEKVAPVATWEFEAEILILHHPTTISVNYQAMVHCGSIRQTATIIAMNLEHMRTGDKAICRFAFIKNPEYLKVGTKMIFREGRTKAIGTISKTNLVPAVDHLKRNQ